MRWGIFRNEKLCRDGHGRREIYYKEEDARRAAKALNSSYNDNPYTVVPINEKSPQETDQKDR